MGVWKTYSLTDIRRDLHAHPESGWKEFRTTALIAERLAELGFDLHLGEDAVNRDARFGVLPDAELTGAISRAKADNAPRNYLEQLETVTGLIAEKKYGNGPIVGVRVDIDALELSESQDPAHRPVRKGFVSQYANEMHACGHDGHVAIGIGLASATDRGEFDGTLKLFFQPAEEGGRGGKAMSETDHLIDVEYFFAIHLGLGVPTGVIIAGFEHPLPNAKLDVVFRGTAAHAGKSPNEGRNAVQALATAIQNLYAIPRHEDGLTRVNAGLVHSPNPQSVISDTASMRVDVRGGDTRLRDYMIERTHRVLSGAAAIHDVAVETTRYGETTTFDADDELIEAVVNGTAAVPRVINVIPRKNFGASEDASYLIRRVQDAGGLATYIGIGADLRSGHHTAQFDFDEDALEIGVTVLHRTLCTL